MASFLVRPGEREGTPRLDAGLVQPASEQIRLAQPDQPERMVPHVTHRDGLSNRLLQQRQSVGGPSGEGVRGPQGRRNQGNEELEGCPLRQVERPFECGEGLVEVALAQRPKAHRPIRHDTAVGVIGCLGNLHPFRCGRMPLGKGTALGQRDDEVTAGEDRGQPRQPQALLEQCPVETRHVLLEALHCPAIVPQAAVDPTKVVLDHDCEAISPRAVAIARAR